MRASVLLEVLWAATHTHRVESRFANRGGILLSAPPGHFKTTFLSYACNTTPGAMLLTDINVKSLMQMKDQIAGNKYHTLAFTDLQKLYERKMDTAVNIIGSLRAMADEGFLSASFEAQGVIETPARALIMGAITPKLWRDHHSEWVDTGFARRMLFCSYNLADPLVIQRSINRDKPLVFDCEEVPVPFGLKIPLDVHTKDEAVLSRAIQGQQGQETTLILMRKILSVLRWKYTKRLKRADRSLDIIQEFSASLGGHGAKLELDAIRSA